MVVAAISEPATLVPPLIGETVGRDISDQIYERLAYLAPGASPIDTSAYRPGLAQRWERIDPLTWRFHLRPAARWQDGRPVTADDVVFSFDAFSDSTLDAGARPYLAGRVHATAEDSATVRIGFSESSPEQLYDATYHVRVFPRHIWDSIPRQRWAADTGAAHLVGSGPYRVQEWQRDGSSPSWPTAPEPVPDGYLQFGEPCGASHPIPMPRSTWCSATRPISWRPWARRTGSSGSPMTRPSKSSATPRGCTAFLRSEWPMPPAGPTRCSATGSSAAR